MFFLEGHHALFFSLIPTITLYITDNVNYAGVYFCSPSLVNVEPILLVALIYSTFRLVEFASNYFFP